MAFALKLSSLSKEDKETIIKDLSVKGNKTRYNDKPNLYRLFNTNTSEDAVYLPIRTYKDYLDKFPHNPNDYSRLKLKFSCELYTKEKDPKNKGRDQDIVVKDALNLLRRNHTAFISCFTGFGKCLAPGTKVLMFDGKKKNVEDILPFEKIMGDDSKPRNILSVCEGEDEMFKIIPTKGETFSVNKSHILTLHISGQGKIIFEKKLNGYLVSWIDLENNKIKNKYFQKKEDAKKYSEYIKENIGVKVDFSVERYLSLSEKIKHMLKLFWVPVNYDLKKNILDPYFLGLWLGCGCLSKPEIATIEKDIVDFLKVFTEDLNLKLYEYKKKDEIPRYNIQDSSDEKNSNNIFNVMKELNLFSNKHIPLSYKTNERNTRLKLLAGLIDAEGYINKKYYEIIQKSKVLALDIQDLCRSLGYACFIKRVNKKDYNKKEKKECVYYRVYFYGNEIEDIPVLLKHKKFERTTHKKNYLITSFKVIPKGRGKYYGFQIDGNGRFLLGSHMVTHNTSTSIYLSCFLGYKTAILCHLTPLKGQWKSEIEKFTGGKAKVQIVEGKKPIDDEAHFYIFGVMKANKMLRTDLLDIGTVIVDEAHLCTATVFTKSILRFQPMYVIGLSATPERVDGLHKLTFKHFGPEKDFIKREEVKKFTVYKYKTRYQPEISYQVVRGETVLAWANIISSISEIKERWKEIAEIAIKESTHKIILLCDRKEMSTNIYNYLLNKGESTELLIGNKKDWDKNKRILVAGVKKGGVGLNDPNLTMLIMAADMKNVKQCEGRIRTSENVVYDIVDDFGTFERHWNLREKWYRKRGAKIVELNPKPPPKEEKKSF